LCGDPRIVDDRTKEPQVFRNPGGSLRYKATTRCTAIFSRLLMRGGSESFAQICNMYRAVTVGERSAFRPFLAP